MTYSVYTEHSIKITCVTKSLTLLIGRPLRQVTLSSFVLRSHHVFSNVFINKVYPLLSICLTYLLYVYLLTGSLNGFTSNKNQNCSHQSHFNTPTLGMTSPKLQSYFSLLHLCWLYLLG